MEDAELQAIIYSVIRANSEKPLKTIIKLISEEIPSVSQESITEALGKLIDVHA